MIHNHEVGGSDPPLATDNQTVNLIGAKKNPSPLKNGEGFIFSNSLAANKVDNPIS